MKVRKLIVIKKAITIFMLAVSKPSKRAKIFRKIGVAMGKNCQIFSNCNFGSEPYLVHLGNNVKITSGCKFITHDGGVEVLRNLDNDLKNIDVFGKIVVGNNVFFGNNCIVMPNCNLGDNIVVAAGSVVTKNFPSNVVIGGVPAKIIKSLEQYRVNILNKCIFTKDMKPAAKKRVLIDFFNE